MTDFIEGSHRYCHICGTRYFEPEGKACDCWKCYGCGEEFSDFDCLGNREKLLCLYCEEERMQDEGELSE